MKKPKLKHCPFCGRPAQFIRQNPAWEETGMYAAMCQNGCATSPDMENKEDVAEWWNRRSKARASK